MWPWFFVGVAFTGFVASAGWLAPRMTGRPRRYRGRHRNPSPQHPAARASDTRPSTAPLTRTERLLEAHFDDEPQNIHTAR